MAIDGSELDFTSCGKLPSESEADGPGLSSRSDSGLEAYDRREVVIGNRKSSDKDSTGYGERTTPHFSAVAIKHTHTHAHTQTRDGGEGSNHATNDKIQIKIQTSTTNHIQFGSEIDQRERD